MITFLTILGTLSYNHVNGKTNTQTIKKQQTGWHNSLPVYKNSHFIFSSLTSGEDYQATWMRYISSDHQAFSCHPFPLPYPPTKSSQSILQLLASLHLSELMTWKTPPCFPVNEIWITTHGLFSFLLPRDLWELRDCVPKASIIESRTENAR